MANAKKAPEKAAPEAGAGKPETSKAPAAAMKKRDAVDQAVDLIGPTFDFIRANLREFFVKMLKVELVALAAGLVLLAIIVAVAVALLFVTGTIGKGAFMDQLFANPVALAILALWLLIGILAMAWISKSISLTQYVITKEQFEGTYPGIWQTFQRIKFPVLSYVILNLGIVLVALGLPLAIVFMLKASAAAFWLGIVVFAAYAVVFLLAYYFFTQFWLWELLLGGKGATEALSASISIVMQNFIGVFIFDIFNLVAFLIITVPFFLVGIALSAANQVGALATMFVAPAAYLAVLVVYILLRIILSLLQSAANATVLLPYSYSFWNAIRKR